MARINDLVKAFQRGEDITNWKCYGPQEMRMKKHLLTKGTLEVNENGGYDVTNYKKVNVNIEAPVIEGTIDITENGTYDVSQYAEANVNIPMPEGTPEVVVGYGTVIDRNTKDIYINQNNYFYHNILSQLTYKDGSLGSKVTNCYLVYYGRVSTWVDTYLYILNNTNNETPHYSLNCVLNNKAFEIARFYLDNTMELINETALNDFNAFLKNVTSASAGSGGVNGFNAGFQNELIKPIISSTPIEIDTKTLIGNYNGATITVAEKGTLDIKEMLSENKLPLKVNVTVDTLQNHINKTKSTKFMFAEYTGTDFECLNDLDFSPVTNANSMFYGCTGLTKSDLTSFTNLTSANYMFYGCTGVTNEIVSYICNAPKYAIDNKDYMFYGCTGLTEVVDTEGKIRCGDSSISMFEGCSNLISYTITTNLSTSTSESNLSRYFRNCINLETVENFMLGGNPPNTSYMFYGCKNLKNLNLKYIVNSLTIGAGSGTGTNDYGTLLTVDSLINTVKELVGTSTSITQTLTMGSANLEKIANIYVKFTDPTQTSIGWGSKGDVVVCESTDEGAMLLKDYATLKRWTLA